MLPLIVAEQRKPKGTHFEPQRASVRAGRLVITRESGPHASALRLIIYKVSAIEPKLPVDEVWQPQHQSARGLLI